MSTNHSLHCRGLGALLLGSLLLWPLSGTALSAGVAPAHSPPPVLEQTDGPATESTIVGVITMLGDDFVVLVRSDESQVRIAIDDSTMLTFEDREATLDDLKHGCLASVMVIQQGGVLHARMVQAHLRP